MKEEAIYSNVQQWLSDLL